MTDKEILDKYIDLESSCLTESETMQVRDMIYEYRDAFSVSDEIGTCPNIEIDIDVTDRTPFFIRPYHVRRGYENIRQGNEKIMLFRDTERRVFTLLKPSIAD